MEKTFKIIKRIFCLFIIVGQLVVLASCPSNLDTSKKEEAEVHGWESYAYFDTVSKIFSYSGETKEEFQKNIKPVSELFSEYHKLFDIYYEYEGIINLCTINKNAGKEKMVVDQKLIDFLLYAKEIYTLTKGENNVMLGSVLSIWHDARMMATNVPEMAYVPDKAELEEAALYTSIDLLEIDDEKNTVRIAHEKARIDVGALGKGYATEKAAQLLAEMGCQSYVLNIGGNIRIIGTKNDGTGWNTGITNPFRNPKYAMYINIKDTSCVTSGNYERYFIYEGKRYHHIIDKDTLMPADHFSSITILVKDSGLADALSTALFAMSYEEGKELVDSLEGVEVIWIDKEGKITYTDGVTPIDL